MPMDPSTANFRHGLRDYVQRLHLPEFWHWWSAELRALIPAAPRNAMQRRRLRPVLVFHREAAVLWAPQTTVAGVAYVETARIPLHGDAAQVRESGAAAIDALARGGRRAGDAGARVIVALTSAQVLRKTLTYPAAVQENLAQVLGYELDRHTPFKADELYYDAVVVARDAARSEIRVELVAALKSVVDQLRRQAAAWGCTVVAVTPGEPQAGMALTAAPRINLLPESERVERSAWRSWQTWVPIGLAGALALAAIIVPLVQKRDAAIELLHASEQARVQAAASDALRQQLERSIDDYNFVLARKYAFPSALQLLQDVTRLLPDDTWLTVLEMKSVPKGKEPHREIMLKGESGNAGRLVSLLEDSNLFEQAAPRSPTTKIQPGPGEIFDLGAQLKALALPPPVALADAAAPSNAAPPSAGAPLPPAGAPAAGPGSPSGAPAGSPAGASSNVSPGISGAGAPGPAPAPATAPAGSAATASSGAAPASAAPRISPGNAPGVGNRAPAAAAAAGPAAPSFGPVSADGRVHESQ